jgi:hypothetical protein
MKRGLFGALLVAAGIAALIVASRHHPGFTRVESPNDPRACVEGDTACLAKMGGVLVGTGFSHTVYDVVRAGGWILIVFGAVIVAFALVRELRRVPIASEP